MTAVMHEVMNNDKPKVGVGVMILKDGKVLLGKRKGSHGAGEYAFPGGHLEYMESFADCAARETKEECGVTIANPRLQFLANVGLYAPKHYVHVGLIADWAGGDPEVREPDKCEAWAWYDPADPPQPLVEAYRSTGTTYYDLPDLPAP